MVPSPLLLLLLLLLGLPATDGGKKGQHPSQAPSSLSSVVDSSSSASSAPVITTSRVFAHVHSLGLGHGAANATTPTSAAAGSTEWLKKLRWIPQRDIKIVRFVDSGRFSNVFEATLNGSDADADIDDGTVYWAGAPTRAILKVLKHTFPGKVKREVRILEMLRDAPGIVRLLGASKNSACHPKTISLLFEHLPGIQWLSHLHLQLPGSAPPEPWTLGEIRLFCYKLLRALLECHRRGIMHRDVKPRNIICQRHSRELRLIDFGLSELYVPRGKYNPSVASRHYKCPELLVDYHYYDYGVDIWAAGCILAGLVFDCEPFFYGADVPDQVHAVASVVGSQTLLDWAKLYKIKLTAAMRRAIGKHPAVPLQSFVTPRNAALCPPEALDLLSRMLCVDHQQRATAEDCLAHPFFDLVRGPPM